MYRIVATDMDETFLNHEHKVPQANIDAVMRMRELGVKFVPASGRPYGSIMHSLRDMPPEALEDSYVISYNGGCINRVGEDKPLTSSSLPFDVVRRIFDWGWTRDVAFHIYEVSGRIWGWRIDPDEIDYLAGHMDLRLLSDLEDPEFLRDVPIAKMLYVHPGIDWLHDLAAEMPDEIWAGTDRTFSSGRYLEFNPPNINKGTGIRKLAELLGIDVADIIGCGDAANDLELIQTAGVGVAVSNATPDVAAAADYRAASSCDDGVFAEVLEHFIEPEHAS